MHRAAMQRKPHVRAAILDRPRTPTVPKGHHRQLADLPNEAAGPTQLGRRPDRDPRHNVHGRTIRPQVHLRSSAAARRSVRVSEPERFGGVPAPHRTRTRRTTRSGTRGVHWQGNPHPPLSTRPPSRSACPGATGVVAFGRGVQCGCRQLFLHANQRKPRRRSGRRMEACRTQRPPSAGQGGLMKVGDVAPET